MKNWLIFILTAILILSWVLLGSANDELRKEKEAQIEALRETNKQIMNDYTDLEQKYDTANEKQFKAEKKADSLDQILSQPHSCEETVRLQGQQIGHLKEALDQCKEAKAIVVKQKGLCMDMVVNHELIGLEYKEIVLHQDKVGKKEKKKSFLKGASVGAVIGALLVILAL